MDVPAPVRPSAEEDRPRRAACRGVRRHPQPGGGLEGQRLYRRSGPGDEAAEIQEPRKLSHRRPITTLARSSALSQAKQAAARPPVLRNGLAQRYIHGFRRKRSAWLGRGAPKFRHKQLSARTQADRRGRVQRQLDCDGSLGSDVAIEDLLMPSPGARQPAVVDQRRRFPATLGIGLPRMRHADELQLENDARRSAPRRNVAQTEGARRHHLRTATPPRSRGFFFARTTPSALRRGPRGALPRGLHLRVSGKRWNGRA